MNFLVIHPQSNLVIGVIASSSAPAITKERSFIPASDKALDAYYKLRSESPERNVELGQLMAMSAYTLDTVTNGKSGTTKPLKMIYR
tara:strand:+ start:1253 stop:1513 length:261 start_codon:yes stop_codon:yes gene_type:complete